MKFRKWWLKLWTALTLMTTIPAFVACSNYENSLYILSGKTQVTEQGRDFASFLQSDPLFDNVDNGAKYLRFNTAAGNRFVTQLTSTFGTYQFPGAFTAANPQEILPYLSRQAISVFEDPQYDAAGKPARPDSEKHNIAIAGEHVNDLIKQLQTTGRSGLLLRDAEGNIIGFPAYTEAMGMIYNKRLFREAGITVVIDKSVNGPQMSQPDWERDFVQNRGTKKVLVINAAKDIATVTKFDQMLSHIQAVLKVAGNNVGGKGVVVSGTESWALTSKVLGIVGIAAAARAAGLQNQGAVIPGETYPPNILTPERAQAQLFSQADQWGIKVMEELINFNAKSNALINVVNGYNKNVDMMDAFQAEQILTMPQGTWVESTLNKTSSLEYGMLPIPATGSIINNTSAIALDAVSHWVIADQVISNHRSESKALAFRTQAINFIYGQYLTPQGAKSINEDQGLKNPFQDDTYLDKNTHPLIVDSAQYETMRWGIAFNYPGVGLNGYERNNATWTDLIKKYSDDSGASMADLVAKALSIWRKK